MVPEMRIHGPPAYFTTDWREAGASVRRLAALEPEVAATGHGRPLSGPDMRRDLHGLADRFEELAVPPVGRYVTIPARADALGVRSVPPQIAPPVKAILAGVGIAAFAGFIASRTIRV